MKFEVRMVILRRARGGMSMRQQWVACITPPMNLEELTFYWPFGGNVRLKEVKALVALERTIMGCE